MIDLHSHILPKLCDGSQDLETSLAMARIAVADGTTHLACTPHIYPNVYENNTAIIRPAMESLQAALDEAGIPLTLVIGADVQFTTELLSGLRRGTIPTLHDSRYFLLEPSHHVPVPGFLEHIENFVNAGYVPVITHPERLHWLHGHYETFLEAARLGAWIQITAGAVTGHFGRSAKNWCERFLADGYVHIIASDAHEAKSRIPVLSDAVQETARLLGDEAEAWRMVRDRPQAVLDNLSPESVYAPPAFHTRRLAATSNHKEPWLRRLFG